MSYTRGEKKENYGKVRNFKNKLFLYLTGIFAGMSVMAVELGASRLLKVFQLVADRVNDHHRNDHDRNGA